jgi:hypothetical protein
MHPAPIVMADRTRKKVIGSLCLVSISYWRRGISVRQYIGGPMFPAPFLLADRTQKMYRNVGQGEATHGSTVLAHFSCHIKRIKEADRTVRCASPIILALQTGKGNTPKKRRRPHKTIKQTSIATVRNYILTVACFPTFLFFHYTLSF